MSRLLAAGAKAASVGRITVRQQLAYKTDFLLRASFLLLILFIFVQLWTTAYGGDSGKTISGFTLKQIIWYLVFTEAITLAGPPLGSRVEEEVKSGDIAIRLLRPISYLGYHYWSYMAESLFRFVVHLTIGSAIAWLAVGAPNFGWGWAGLLSLSIGALTLSYLLTMSVALCAFWVEETRGLEFVLQKLMFTIGGMLLPIDLMPEWLQRICVWLPFQAALYYPARAGVRFDADALVGQIFVQAAWVVALVAVVTLIYRRGVAKLHVNGG